MAMDFGVRIDDSTKVDVVQIGQSDTFVPGAYYEAVYQTGALNQAIPGWEQRVHDEIVNNLAGSCPTCQVVYIHVENNGLVTVQWQYNLAEGYSAYVPLLVWAVVLIVGAAIVLYLANVFVNSVTQFAKSNSTDFTMIVIAGVIISAAILVFAGTNAYKSYKMNNIPV